MFSEVDKSIGATPGYWTKQQAATYLGVQSHSIDYLVRTHQLAFYMIAGKRRFTRSDLDAYAQKGYNAPATTRMESVN